MLTPDQYAKNVETIPGTNERVEFAIKLPAKTMRKRQCGCRSTPNSLRNSTNALLDAAERADADAVAQAGKELERAVRGEAKTIAEKYVSPPLTTDFRHLFCRPKACTLR